jgi:hypothetical protein
MVVFRSAAICEIDTFMTELSRTITNCAAARMAIATQFTGPLYAADGQVRATLRQPGRIAAMGLGVCVAMRGTEPLVASSWTVDGTAAGSTSHTSVSSS